VVQPVTPVPRTTYAETSSAPPASASPTPTPTTPPGAALHATCPIPLDEPAHTGGLQSLIDFAPAFGPFSAEAFAAAAAYQPALQLIGPILAQYPKLAPTLKPALRPFLDQWQKLLTLVDGLIAPFYAPMRPQLLEAETKLAAYFAPYAEKLVDSPLGACIVDLEAALVADTRPDGSHD
jgi:hypothetical protein